MDSYKKNYLGGDNMVNYINEVPNLTLHIMGFVNTSALYVLIMFLLSKLIDRSLQQ